VYRRPPHEAHQRSPTARDRPWNREIRERSGNAQAPSSAQRYEHVRRTAHGSVVRYVDRGLFDGFEAELELDADGLVVRYPELAMRVADGPAEP